MSGSQIVDSEANASGFGQSGGPLLLKALAHLQRSLKRSKERRASDEC
jgi:hypothetical protein